MILKTREMDYSRCLYDPFGKDTVQKLEQYPEFQFECEDKAKVIAYLILMYDIASSEVRTYSDRLYERKKFAAIKAGFKLDKDGKFDEEIEKIIIGENDAFNDAVIRYVRMFGLPDLPRHTAYNEMLDKELAAAHKETDPKIRKVIRENIDELSKEIEAIERKIFTGEETENVRKSLYRLMEKQKLGLRPEDMAVAIEEKKIRVPDVYNLL